MPVDSKYILVVSMDVTAEYEALFNEVYDTEHVPYLLKVNGVYTVSRIVGKAFSFALAGSFQQVEAPVPRYSALYEIADPHVVASPEWAKAVETGRWATEVRPHTSDRSHAMYELI